MFYDGFGFVIKIFVIEVDISSSMGVAYGARSHCRSFQQLVLEGNLRAGGLRQCLGQL